MSKASLSSCILSALAVAGIAVVGAGFGGLRSTLRDLDDRVAQIEGGKPPSQVKGRPTDAENAEIQRLKQEIAGLRRDLAALPASTGGAVTKKDLREAVEGVLESKRVAEMEKAARMRGVQMTAAEKKRLDQMSGELQLDEAQKLRVKDVLDRQVEGYVKLWSSPPSAVSSSGSSDGNSPWLEEMKRIDAEADQGVKEILSPEQREKYGRMPAVWFDAMGGGGLRR